MSENLQVAVQRVLAGSRDEADLMAIATAIQTGQFTWASGRGAVGVGGDVVNSLIVPGSYNIIDSTIVLDGEAAIAIQTLLTQRLGVAPISAIPVDELLQQVRSWASTKILNLFSQIQLLNKRQVAVDQLYVDVYVLEVREFRATIPGLLEGQDAREQFDRFGLGKRGERSPGLAIAASEDFPRLMVLGKPGAGKSTFLRHLAVSCARGEFLGDYIPVLLELRDVDEAAFSLFQCLHEEFGLEQESQTEQILKQGRVLLLLDGLDEVPSSLRQRVQHELRKFAKRYDKNRFILTCRTQTTEYIPEQFQAVEVADFKPEQVECFALHWFTAMAGTSEQGMALKNHFMEKLRESPQTAELAVTPVLLSLTCWIFDDLKDLPQKRSDLYRDGLDLLLRQWDQGRGISRDSGSDHYRQLTTEERKQLLSYVAVRKFEQAENFVLYEETELCGYIAEHLQLAVEESRDVLQAIAQHHGLLITRAQGIWSFSHLTFQEYLVAKRFCDRANWKNLCTHIAELHWKEVFLLASESPDKTGLLKTFRRAVDSLLENDRDLQIFLERVYSKTKRVCEKFEFENGSNLSLKVRAFYFAINRNDVLGLDPNYSYSSNKSYLRFDNILDSAEVPLDCAIDYELALLLYNAYCIATNPPYINAYSYDHVINLFLTGYEKLFRYPIDPEYKKAFKNIKNSLPSFSLEDWNGFKEWGVKEGKVWADGLRELIISYRDIRHSLYFLSEEQWKLLEKYYEANNLLMNCLNNCGVVNNKLRKEIEETLLLPIAEIEKRKNQSLN